MRKGKLSPEILQASLATTASSATAQDTAFKEGDLVMHPVWNKGKVKAVDREKNQYIVHFFEMDKEKPIDFAFRFLEPASDAEEGSVSPSEFMDIHEGLKSAPDPFAESLHSNRTSDDIFDDENPDQSSRKNNSADGKWPE